MATAEIKRVLKLGGSLAIILPQKWARGKLEAGDEVVVVGNGDLRIFPVHHSEDSGQEGVVGHTETEKCSEKPAEPRSE